MCTNRLVVPRTLDWSDNFFILRWYWTPPFCDILFTEINNKIKDQCINSFFPVLSANSVAQWVREFTTNIISYEFKTGWEF